MFLLQKNTYHFRRGDFQLRDRIGQPDRQRIGGGGRVRFVRLLVGKLSVD